jgi:hypothetical protein
MLLSPATRARNNHYEYMKMGSRNSIFANAGLARFEDQSAVIFNPATFEITGILGIGWNISEKTALGISFTASSVPVNAQTSSVDFVSFQNSFYTRYYKVMAITKLGLAMKLDKWDIDITAHLPSLGLFG